MNVRLRWRNRTSGGFIGCTYFGREAKDRMNGVTLDAGRLTALDRNDRRVLVLIARAEESGMRITIPAMGLAQAIRNPAKQARLSRLIRQAGMAWSRWTPVLAFCLEKPQRLISQMLTSSRVH